MRLPEPVLFTVLLMTGQARRMDDVQLAREWSQAANSRAEVTAWYHVLSSEMSIRWPGFPGGLRRGGSVEIEEPL